MEAFLEELFSLQQEKAGEPHTGSFLVVVIYDVSDNKRRLKVSKVLSGFGKRVQKSAFECIINRKQYDMLLERLKKVIGEEDLLRVYKISGGADVKIWGDISLTEFEEDIIL